MSQPTIDSINDTKVFTLESVLTPVSKALITSATALIQDEVEKDTFTGLLSEAWTEFLGCDEVGGCRVAPLLVRPDEKLRIKGSNFLKASVVVRAMGVTVVGRSEGAMRPALTPPTENEITFYVPSLWELQSTTVSYEFLEGRTALSYQYHRNALLMPLLLDVSNGPDSTSSKVLLGVVLPPPSVGSPRISGQTVTIGSLEGSSADETDDFGRSPNPSPRDVIPGDANPGALCWYGIEQLEELESFPNLDYRDFLPRLSPAGMLEDAGSLWTNLFQTIAQGLSLVPQFELVHLLPENLLDSLHDLRENRGRKLTPTEWHDDGVSFEIPADTPFGTGLAVVWRDDLPSRPIPICNPAIDCSKAAAIRDTLMHAASELWSFAKLYPCLEDNDGNYTLQTPFEPGEWVHLAADRFEADVNNVVQRLLGNSGFTATFQIQVSGPGLKDGDCQTKDSAGADTNQQLTTGFTHYVPLTPDADAGANQLMLQVRPRVCAQETYSDGDNQSVSVRLLVSFTIPGCSCNDLFQDIPIGPVINFTVKPVLIPTFAVFFTGADCGRRPLLVLPKSGVAGLLPGGNHWDMSGHNHQPSPGPGWLEEMYDLRDELVAGLTLSHEVLDVLKCFYDPPWLDQIEDLLVTFRRQLEFVIDTTGRLDDLGLSVYEGGWPSPQTFGRRIEAVLLIGPPSDESGISYECYTEVTETGDRLTLKIPQGKYIAGFGDLNCLGIPFVFGGVGAVGGIGGVGGTTVPSLPEIEQSRSRPWGKSIASIKVVES
jgi:hypothetical protein